MNLRQLSSWLGVIAVALTLVMIYLTLIKSAESTSGSRSLLPTVSCPNGKADKVPEITFETGKFFLLYRDRGCNAIDPQLPIDAVKILDDAEEKFRALRLPRMRTRYAIGAARNAPGKSPTAEVSVRGGDAGAVMLRYSGVSDPHLEFLLRRSAAELMIDVAAPGLAPASRRELAAAYSLIAAGDQRAAYESYASDGAMRLAAAIRINGLDWIPKQLAGCIRECQLPAH